MIESSACPANLIIRSPSNLTKLSSFIDFQ